MEEISTAQTRLAILHGTLTSVESIATLRGHTFHLRNEMNACLDTKTYNESSRCSTERRAPGVL